VADLDFPFVCINVKTDKLSVVLTAEIFKAAHQLLIVVAAFHIVVSVAKGCDTCSVKPHTDGRCIKGTTVNLNKVVT
jgi:hypothetical protein